MEPLHKRLLSSLLYYLVTGLCICGLAFVNQYPLVYADSGSYIRNSFELLQNDDRPLGYGLIIRAVTWQSTMWTVVLFQGVLASWLLMLIVREGVQGSRHAVRVHVVLLALLLWCSSLPWYAAQLMPDHFTPLVLLIAFLLFKGKALGPWREGALWVLLFFLLATHNAHFAMAGLLGLMVLFGALRNGVWRQRSFLRRWAAFSIVVAGSAFMIMCFNYVDHGRMRLSRAGNVFFAGRLCEGGIMADYLKEVCPAPDNPLCDCQDDLPGDAGDMLWNDIGLPNRLHITIGQADSLLAPVVADILQRPEYAGRFVRSAAVSTLVQLFQFDAGTGLHRYEKGSSPQVNLGKLHDEMYSYLHAEQQYGAWNDTTVMNRRIAFVLVLSLVVLAFCWTGTVPRTPTFLTALSIWACFWIVANAAVTSSLSVVDPRLQSRVMWLLPVVAFLILVRQPSLRSFFRLAPSDVSAS